MSIAVLHGWTKPFSKPSALPGFGITLGFTVT